MFSRVTDLSTSICHTTTGQHNQLKMCVMHWIQASPKCNLGASKIVKLNISVEEGTHF